MADQESHTFESALAARHEHIKKHELLRASADYQAELKFSRRLSLDFARSLSVVGLYSTRARHINDDMLVIRSCDDLIQSSLAIASLTHEGFINPIHRELRYMIERLVKALYVDQLHPAKSLKDRIAELASVPASLDVAKDLKLSMLDPANAKLFVDELLDVYSKACAYVHPSRSQVDEQIRRVEAGAPLGFETVEHLRKINQVTRRAYDLLLVMFFHALGPSMTGDLFTMILDDTPDWTFHRGAKYMKLVAAFFDYKLERQ